MFGGLGIEIDVPSNHRLVCALVGMLLDLVLFVGSLL